MKTPKELEMQESVISALQRYDIYPFSVTCTFGLKSSGILGITFYLKSDLSEVLKILDYQSQCDKSGYLILEDNNTLVLEGMALVNLYTRL